MANTRKLDRIISDTETKLRSLGNGETTFLNAGEKARFAAHVARGGYQVTRGKSPAGADRAIDKLFEEAQQRLTAELSAARAARQQAIAQAAADKVAEKSESRWW
ncbi:hypothetical protein HZZ00_37235 (plasmid) [Streptomyces sp. NEAU-sy36]|uniref:hypothetical protein n=1 Tax=unclassified Streptomyces TaxID=2593676 RepID=UPI0015D5C9CC|nr:MULTISPECIES: hypothetical protein [unclassified Streptomyces]QLJ06678.1 hypothetical protein HZZ00_37235 [Streptomyces sp. NEAU-sy36]